ncbi:uncharacterized protein BDV14DRAFT_107259 [Aspergillus stella-maris]|uniref:uncharacterized protein n=1 Tax=Aspergillus stella-maris TaxID=1810926 RepID=UPI003CCD56B2
MPATACIGSLSDWYRYAPPFHNADVRHPAPVDPKSGQFHGRSVKRQWQFGEGRGKTQGYLIGRGKPKFLCFLVAAIPHQRSLVRTKAKLYSTTARSKNRRRLKNWHLPKPRPIRPPINQILWSEPRVQGLGFFVGSLSAIDRRVEATLCLTITQRKDWFSPGQPLSSVGQRTKASRRNLWYLPDPEGPRPLRILASGGRRR